MEYKQMTPPIYSCNLSLETLAWNRACLDYTAPHCNISKDTQKWNRLCLDYALENKAN